jgi:hypothetical protein
LSKIVLLIFCFIISSSFGQDTEFQTWIETGVKGKLVKRFDYSVDLTNRIGNLGLETFFPQATLKYKVADWFKPSIDYRIIFKKEPNSNYNSSNRLNLNLNFNKLFNRFNIGLRLRYQYSFSQIAGANYQPEFDKAYRIKPSVSYDINNSILTPSASIEFFYNPVRSSLGQRFTKMRVFIGTELELKGPHGIELGYIYDQSMNLPDPSTRHILNLSYVFKIETPKKKKKKVDSAFVNSTKCLNSKNKCNFSPSARTGNTNI